MNTLRNLAFILTAALGCAMLAASLPVSAQMENTGGVLLPQAVRNATATSTDRQNVAWRGLQVIVNITTWTSGTFTPTIQGKDPVSGAYYTLLTGAGIATSSSSPVVLRVYPGLAAGTNIANDVLPRTWRVQVVGTATPSAAYSVGFQIVQ